MSTEIKVILSQPSIGFTYSGLVLISLFSFWFVNPVFSQLHDYNWILGYDGGPDMPIGDSFGLSILTFTEEKLAIVAEEEKGGMFFNMNNVSYSDEFGSFLCSFNGKGVYNKEHSPMTNGNDWFNGDLSAGWLHPQSGLILPFPENPIKLLLMRIKSKLKRRSKLIKFVECDFYNLSSYTSTCAKYTNKNYNGTVCGTQKTSHRLSLQTLSFYAATFLALPTSAKQGLRTPMSI